MAWTSRGSLKGGNGARGAKIFFGTGAPSTVAGSQAGDVYIDTDTFTLYELV